MKIKAPLSYLEETVVIEKIISGGYGLSHLSNDKVIMIKHALPHEEILVSYKENNKDFCFGKIKEIIKPSPLRIEPLCPLFTSCGGCQFQMLHYENQLHFKHEIIKESLSRIAKKDLDIHPLIASERSFHYRNKGSFQVFKQGEIGFCKPGTTIPFKVSFCPLMEEPINERIKHYEDPLQKEKIKNLKALNIRSNIDGDVIDSQIKGSFFIDKVSSLGFIVDIDTFFQVNRFIIPLWLEKIKSLVEKYTDGKELLDLFCGVGIIGQYLSPLFKKVVGIEVNKRLIENGNKVLEMNNIHNMSFINEDASLFTEHSFIYDTIIVNPPRTGLPTFMTKQLLSLKPKVIIYSSCNVDTFARDISLLIDEGGYFIEEVQPFDMFPQTHHVEVIGVLFRK
jgi:tRNA/tmRNA/rRNA uracil-C5-methylase (TrmA/RlmC/RlmD family)